jgi:hypothetical protein
LGCAFQRRNLFENAASVKVAVGSGCSAATWDCGRLSFKARQQFGKRDAKTAGDQNQRMKAAVLFAAF